MATEFESYIESSSLSAEDKELWQTITKTLEPEQVQAFENFVDKDPARLILLTENIKLKREAFQNNDTATIEKILASEQVEQ